MSFSIPQPHSILVITPLADQSDSSGAGKLDYGDPFGDPPAISRTVQGMFQSRGGTQVIEDEGSTVPLDGVFFTTDQLIAADDILDVILPGQIAKYKVVGVEPKYDTTGGIFNHNEVSLVREFKQ